MSAASAAVEVEGLRHGYGKREVLCGIDLRVEAGEILAFLGPNGGGKTTLFRILSTALRPQVGSARILGLDSVREAAALRRRIGVVFQRPGLDPRLTVRENLWHHGRLYGLGGAALRDASDRWMKSLGVLDRAGDLVGELSGGLARRAELARALLHGPELLLLDEPSTGLDPGARRDFADALRSLSAAGEFTVVLTTHFVEEADRADRVAVLDRGTVAALDDPEALKRSVGGDVVAVHAEDVEAFAAVLKTDLGLESRVVDGAILIERERGHELVRDLVERYPEVVQSVRFGRPTLEDAYVHWTGRQLYAAADDEGGEGKDAR